MFLFGRRGSPTAIAAKGRGPKMDRSLMPKRIKKFLVEKIKQQPCDFFGEKRKENNLMPKRKKVFLV